MSTDIPNITYKSCQLDHFGACLNSAIDDAIEDADYCTMVVWIEHGITSVVTHSDILCVDMLLTQMIDQAYNEYSDLAESYCSALGDIDREAKAEFHCTILPWLAKYAKDPDFYTVESKGFIPVFVGDECNSGGVIFYTPVDNS